jgi:hypothetical protein
VHLSKGGDRAAYDRTASLTDCCGWVGAGWVGPPNLDGNFPNHVPNPEDAAAMKAAQAATLASHADLGIIFDTDVDRAAVVDADGTEINRDRLIALLAGASAPPP